MIKLCNYFSYCSDIQRATNTMDTSKRIGLVQCIHTGMKRCLPCMIKYRSILLHRTAGMLAILASESIQRYRKELRSLVYPFRFRWQVYLEDNVIPIHEVLYCGYGRYRCRKCQSKQNHDIYFKCGHYIFWYFLFASMRCSYHIALDNCISTEFQLSFHH